VPPAGFIGLFHHTPYIWNCSIHSSLTKASCISHFQTYRWLNLVRFHQRGHLAKKKRGIWQIGESARLSLLILTLYLLNPVILFWYNMVRFFLAIAIASVCFLKLWNLCLCCWPFRYVALCCSHTYRFTRCSALHCARLHTHLSSMALNISVEFHATFMTRHSDCYSAACDAPKARPAGPSWRLGCVFVERRRKMRMARHEGPSRYFGRGSFVDERGSSGEARRA